MMAKKWSVPGGGPLRRGLIGIAMIMAIGAQASVAQAAEATDVIRELDKSGLLEQAIERILDRLGDKQRRAQEAGEKAESEMKEKMANNVRPADESRDHILGAPGAEISIIEYSDFECPYCKRFHETPQSLVRKLGAGVNLVFRHFPLDFHDPMATREAVAATCAGMLGGNPQFWAFANAVMGRTQTNGKGIPAKGKADPLVALATSLKLDPSKFLACIKSEEAMRKVKEDIADGIKSGINGTPGVILRNNRTGRVISLAGAVPESILEEKIRELSR